MATTEPRKSRPRGRPATGAADGRHPLSRDAIVAAAIDLADESGESGLTMRKLAESLGYEVMSLYNHVANKSQLLDLMVEAVAAETPEPAEDLAPLEALRTFAIDSRAALERHPWAANLLLRQMPGPVRIAHMELQLRLLAVSGLSPELAHHGYHAVNNHVVGYTLQHQALLASMTEFAEEIEEFTRRLSNDDHPHVIEHVEQHRQGETGSSFELVLDFILDGLRRLNEADSRPT
ncbi:MAG: TetR/AcrR family transcriptional regulator C-terminal domain-containing protein [Actinomycetota bacterium]